MCSHMEAWYSQKLECKEWMNESIHPVYSFDTRGLPCWLVVDAAIHFPYAQLNSHKDMRSLKNKQYREWHKDTTAMTTDGSETKEMETENEYMEYEMHRLCFNTVCYF